MLLLPHMVLTGMTAVGSEEVNCTLLFLSHSPLDGGRITNSRKSNKIFFLGPTYRGKDTTGRKTTKRQW